MERLTRHLNKGIPNKALQSYLQTVRKWVTDEPVIHIDDSDIIKPNGYKFEALDTVRDGSKSNASKEKGFTSINNITFDAMERGNAMFGKATFLMDRGYDDNKMFLMLDKLKQDYVIRLTTKRKLLFIINGFLLQNYVTAGKEK